jgi:HEAT repeat protein
VSSNINPEPENLRFLPPIAIGTVVLAVVGLLWVLNRPMEPPPPPPPSKRESLEDRLKRHTKDLTDRSSEVRRCAARDLGAMGPDARDAVPQLIELLRDTNPEVRQTATAALDQIDKDWPKRDQARAAVPQVIEQLWDRDQKARTAAMETLDRVDPNWRKRDEETAAVAQLIKQLGNKDTGLAMETLDQIDKDWPERAQAKAVPQLIQALWNMNYGWDKLQSRSDWDGYYRVQETACRTLDRIDANWRESAEMKKGRANAIKNIYKEPSCIRAYEKIDKNWRGTEEARVAFRTSLEHLNPKDNAAFEDAVAVLDLIDSDWPRDPEAKAAAKRWTDGLVTWKGDIPLNLAETLDRIDPTWAHSDQAKKAFPELLKRLEHLRWRSDYVAVVALLVRIDRDALEPEEGPIISRLTEMVPKGWDPQAMLAMKTLGRIGTNPAVVPVLIEKLDEALGEKAMFSGSKRRFWFDRGRYHHEVAVTAAEALGGFGKEAEAAVTPLLELLAARDDWPAELRRVTVQSLGRIGVRPAAVVPALVKELRRDRDEAVPQAAAEALGRFGKDAAIAVPALIKDGRIAWDYDRLATIQALGSIGPAAAPAVPALLEVLRERRDDANSVAAVQALGRIGASARTVVPDLLRRLERHGHSNERELRLAVVEALGRFGGDAAEAVPALLPLLLDEADIVESAVWTWASLPSTVADATLALWVARLGITDRVEKTRMCRAALTALDRIDGKWPQTEAAKKLLPGLLKRLDLANADLRHEAVLALGRFGKEAAPAVPQLLKLLDDPDPKVRRDVTSALVRIDDAWTQPLDPARAARLLGEVLTDRSPAVRKKAAQTLGGLAKDGTGAIGGLVLLLADSDEDVVKAAAEALGRIDDNWLQTEAAKNAIPGLVHRLRDPLGAVRTNAAAALGRFDGAAAGAITALVVCAADAVKDVRTAALAALERIDRDWPQSPAAKKAVPRLDKLRGSDDAEVRNAAAWLLKKINP